MKPLKRIAGFLLFFVTMAIFTIPFVFIAILLGIDAANTFMDKHALPFVDWLD